MSARTTMEAIKKTAQTIIPSRSVTPQHRLALPQHVDEVPTSKDQSLHDTLTEPGFGHNFSQIQVHPQGESVQLAMEACPLALTSPRFCPFGGACHTCPVPLQPKLTIGQPNDRYEQEADRVAEQVMRMPEPRLQRQVEPEEEEEEETLQAKPLAAQIPPLVQRQVQPEKEEEAVQAKLVAGAPVQRQEEEREKEEKEHIQAKRAGKQTPEVGPSLAAQTRSLRSGGQPLPRSVRGFSEASLGHNFGQIRIHTDARAAKVARALNAQAFTLGRDIVFAEGRYAPETAAGRRLLTHELTHVIQQRAGANAHTIRRVCRPRQKRASTDPNEGQKPGIYQSPHDPCIWVLYGFHIGSSEFMVAFTPAVSQLTQFMRQDAAARISLKGFTDCFGAVARNMKLGIARSGNVQNAFPAELHSRIDREPSDGKTYLVRNDTPLRRAANRSVRVVVKPPKGVACPKMVRIEKQLSPVIARGKCDGYEGDLLLATKAAVPMAITALARVRNWRNSKTTGTLLDIYYKTANDAERAKAATRVIRNLEVIMRALQKPVIDCALPGKTPKYKQLCPAGTIADAGGASGILIPTFCFPQFRTIQKSLEARAITVIHEFSHRYNATTDYGAYYTANTCDPTTSTAGLSRDLRLSHADTFACFVGMTALQPPR